MSETIKRVADRTKNYTTMMNEALKRSDLSARAKGIYAYLMTLPNDWIIHKEELQSHFTEGREALDTAFKELIKAGYVTLKIERGENAKIMAYAYSIHELSIPEHERTSELVPRKPYTAEPLTASPVSANPQLLSTDLVLKTEELKTDKEPLPLFQDLPKKETGTKARPTLDEVKAYCQERKKGVDPERWFNHYQSNGWVIGKALAPMKDWKAAVHTWENSSITTSEQRSNVSQFQKKEATDDSWRFVDPLESIL